MHVRGANKMNWIDECDESTLDSWIYEIPEFDDGDQYRCALGWPRTSDGRYLVCVGINPNTAKPGKATLDKTTKKVRELAFRHGYDGFILINPYPLRGEKPECLPRCANHLVMEENFAKIKGVLFGKKADVLAAWGNAIDERAYIPACVGAIESIVKQECNDAIWLQLGECTKDGNPRHPLYVAYRTPLRNFDINKYLEKKLQID